MTSSLYQQLLVKLQGDKCTKCSGLGELDDADLGDISYNTWICDVCLGTGLLSKGKDWE